MKKQAEILVPVLLCAVFVLLLAVSFVPASQIGLDTNPYMAVVAIQLLIYSIPTLFYCRLRGIKAVSGLRLIMPKLSHIFFLTYAMVFLICGSSLISIGMYSLAPELFSQDTIVTYSAFAMNDTVFDGLFVVIAFAILPAVTEELLFRGVVISEYEHDGAVVAALVSSLTFAMSHFSFSRLPIYIFSGLVLAVVLYTTRSIIASIIVHSVNNAVVLFLEGYVLEIVKKENISEVLLIVVLSVLTLLSLTLLCFTSAGIYNDYANYEEVNDEYIAQSVRTKLLMRIGSVITIPFAVLVVLYILATFFMQYYA